MATGIKTKLKIWFFCILWLILTLSVAACLSFTCEKIVEKFIGYETDAWFWFTLTYTSYFRAHFLPNLIAVTLLVLVTRFPPTKSKKIPTLLFGLILPLNVIITLFHIDLTFHKFPKPMLLRNAFLFHIILLLSLSVLTKISWKFFQHLSNHKSMNEIQPQMNE